jgi:hypothetical protein
MHRRTPITTLAALLVCALATPALAGDFIDARLSFVLSENNFFADPGETEINSPGFGIGADKSNTLFFDNYETKFSGFETMSHLVLYKKMPAFFDYLTTEAALVVRFLIQGESSGDDWSTYNKFYDAGSYIRLVYDLSQGDAKDKNIELVVFPVSGDRFRLGYSYKISWGGSRMFPLRKGDTNLVPAMKLQLNLPWGYGFLGLKTTRISENINETNQTEQVTNYGVLAGLGVDIEGIRAEVNGGFFTRGNFQEMGVLGFPMYGGGGSYQVGYHSGMPIGTSIDFSLYKNDPDIEAKFFKPENYDDSFSFVVKHEGSILFQTLSDPDRYGTTVNQLAYAFDINFLMKWKYLRAHLDAMFRTMSFLLYEVPSFTPYQEFPDTAEVSPEYFVALGVDYHFPTAHLTPGLVFGMQQPATYTIQDLDVGGATFLGKRTVVVRDIASRSILPVNEGSRLIWSVKATCKWDISEILAVVAEVYYSYDDNQVRYVSDFQGLNVYSTFTDPNILGLNIAAQARF